MNEDINDKGPNHIDTVTFEVIAAALQSAAEEMGSLLKRSSYSPIIRDMDDFSCALFTASGDLVAQADYIPAQLGAMSLVVKATIERWRDRIIPGDAFISNHPYMGAMHLPDVNVVAPIFLDGRAGRLVGHRRAPHRRRGCESGQRRPGTGGSVWRGVVLPPVRLSIAGVENEDLVAVLTQNIRDPRSTVSDLRAQRAACGLGDERVRELASQYGTAAVLEVMDRMLDAVERGVRNALAALPDGEGEAEGFLDDDGRGGRPTRVHVRVRKSADRLDIDLSGCDRQVAGAMNVPWASARAGIVYAVRAAWPRTRRQRRAVACGGRHRAAGHRARPEPPAAVSVRHNTCQRFADTLIRAMAAIWPEKGVGSSTVSFFCINVGSISPVTGRPSVMADVVGGGTGRTRPRDGIDGVDTYMSNVGVMPTEVVETNYSVRVLKTEFIVASQGLGTHNGGLGLRREYQIIGSPQRVTYYSEQTQEDFAPCGAAGGGDAMATKVTVIGPDGAR